MEKIMDLLPPEAWATYIVGLGAIGLAIWQLNRKFILNKKTKVFDELSADTQEASELVLQISNDTKSLVEQLAAAANSADYDNNGKTSQQNDAEIKRRLKEIDDTAKKHEDLIVTIYESYKTVLILIRKVEKSTIISDKSREAARHLFYIATEQHEMLKATNSVLRSFQVSPALGERPNISSETFNAFLELLGRIDSTNQDIVTYLSDLEVILHNDLVKPVFGQARAETVPAKHLTPDGITDKRTKDNLF